jgi:hypothetical protein
MRPFEQVRERPSGENAEDGLIQFHAGLVQGARFRQFGGFAAKIAQDRSLARLDDRLKCDLAGQPIEHNSSGHSSMGAENSRLN